MRRTGKYVAATKTRDQPFVAYHNNSTYINAVICEDNLMTCAVNSIFDCAGVCNIIQFIITKKEPTLADSFIYTVICEDILMRNG